MMPKKIQKQTKIFVNFPKTFLKNILINYSICRLRLNMFLKKNNYCQYF